MRFMILLCALLVACDWVIVSGQDFENGGFGCYNLPGVGRACTCGEEFCNEVACTSAQGIWTNGCTSCRCSDTGVTGPTVAPRPSGTGCYGMPENPQGCTCNDAVCASKDVCSVLYLGIWSDECQSCRCEDLDDDLEDDLTMSMSMSMSMPLRRLRR